tara:strand:- start:25 stop:330 length:306 start_codon:yes stop_codon:yes gene_type:complete
VLTASSCDHPATGRALQESKLEKIGLNHGFQRGGILSKSRRKSVQPSGTTSMRLEQQLQQPAITGIQSTTIHPMQSEGFIHQRLVDRAGTFTNTGHIPHSP